jgi:hypothetical protein
LAAERFTQTKSRIEPSAKKLAASSGVRRPRTSQDCVTILDLGAPFKRHERNRESLNWAEFRRWGYTAPTNLDEFQNRRIKEFAIRQCMKERAGFAALTRA